MGKMEKAVNQFTVLDPEDVEEAQDICGNTGANYIKVKMLFNKLMTKFLDSSNIEELMQHMIAHINMQVKKTLNALEWFYTRSNYAPAHKLQVRVETRKLLY